eukprot:TRINITY_DN6148_c0_g1_i6.p1 TRINITY_DN6148_c0_g1~~TRINITY_DN6148_c0_g1_i6.p1  ORF type:complete len:571 (+),score=137.07 TRINITY_DN6148_c0_g1_i6:219-1715(+)
MGAPPKLLTDEQMGQFLVDGFLVIESDLPRSFHEALYTNAEVLKVRSNNPGNNVLPTLPALQQVFDSPSVKGALTSVLGKNYLMHPHRHPHCNAPGFKGQNFHRDSYWGHGKIRHHFPRWVMLMYYPQDTPVALGPTSIAPATQYLSMPNAKNRHFVDPPAEWTSRDQPMACNAGTVVMIHYDIWHKGTPNHGDINRYMFKFQFTRMEEPSIPTWDFKDANLPRSIQSLTTSDGKPVADLMPLWAMTWHWLCGEKRIDPSRIDLKSIQPSILDSESIGDEVKRLHTAYNMGLLDDAQCHDALDILKDGMSKGDECKQRNCMFALISMGILGNPAVIDLLSHLVDQSPREDTKIYAAFALGELGKRAGKSFSLLLDRLNKTRSQLERRNLVEAIGNVPSSDQDRMEVANALLQISASDRDEQTRFQAMLSLAKLADVFRDDTKAIEKIAEIAMTDADRYVKGYALDALRRIPSMAAKDTLLQMLWTSRWCDITNPSSTF